MRTCIPDMRACDSSPSILREKKYENEIKKTVHIKKPEQTCSVHCLNMYSDDGPGNVVIWEPQSDYRVILFYIYMYIVLG